MAPPAPPARGLSEWVLRHLPEVVAVNPERTLINAGCFLIGLSTVVEGPQSPLHTLWPLAEYEWGAAMLLGGAASLLGMLRRQRSTERLGLVLILMASLFFAGFLVGQYGPRGLITALIFVFIAAAKAVRLAVTAVARRRNIVMGERMSDFRSTGDDPWSSTS